LLKYYYKSLDSDKIAMHSWFFIVIENKKPERNPPMSPKTTVGAAVLFASILSACGQTGRGGQVGNSSLQEAWNRANNPITMRPDLEYTLSRLPLQAALEVAPWSDTYWPSSEGGIAARWNGDGGDDDNAWEYQSPTRSAAGRMSQANLAKLSPAEKYSIFVDDFSYRLVSSERQRVSPDNASWEGICHGWAPAAINFKEPKPITLEAANGIKVPFGSADVKALLDYFQGEVASSETRFLGERCNADLSEDPDAANRPECRDTNAGSFHVVIANLIGLKKKAFVADVTRDQQVWNQPVHAFASEKIREQEPSPGAARGTVKEVVFKTKMTYTVETGAIWDATNETDEHADKTVTYTYRVELNRRGQVIGGEWESKNRPDFLWSQARPRFSGFFSELNDIYKAATAE